MKNNIFRWIGCACLFIGTLLTHTACNKQNEFLDKKPNSALSVPVTLSDFDLLLNNETLFNAYSSPALGTMSGDDFYVTNADWLSAGTVTEQNTYLFATDIYRGSNINPDWSTPYQQIYYCNTVLDGLKKINVTTNQLTLYNTIKGTALFFRAYAFYNLVQTFAMPYDQQSSATDPGIPLVTSADLNIRYSRGTVQGTYAQIINDINSATTLLPSMLTSVTKPCKISCDAFLARVYLAMANYQQSLDYANKCLAADSKLVDYNLITPQTYNLSATILVEDIFHTSLLGYDIAYDAQMDSTLFKTYDQNDLRKTYFFRTAYDGIDVYFRGSYDLNNLYSGLATDEVYLIRAECNARAGNLVPALNDLNELLKNRYVTGKYIQASINNKDDLLKRILLEREKELYMRGLRWTDLRRLNKEDEFKKSVVHVINSVTYILPPNDPKYAMPIPDQEVQLTGIAQNIR